LTPIKRFQNDFHEFSGPAIAGAGPDLRMALSVGVGAIPGLTRENAVLGPL
jgi:hypothetical protein